MGGKVNLSKKCIKLAMRAGDDEDEPATSDGGDGFSEAVLLASNTLRC
jgi:hypothetical protein